MMCALPVAAETVTVQSFLDQKEKWSEWAQQKTPLVIEGRYEGRVARQFRLAKLPMLITPSRITSLPLEVQSGERMTVSGILKQSGTRYELEATRIAIGRTDHERMAARIKKLGADDVELWYPLAEEYSAIAEFYGDDFLRTQVKTLRLNAFNVQRKQAAGDALRLSDLIEKGPALEIDPAVLAAIRFESIVAMTKQKSPDTQQIESTIKNHLTGWDSKTATLDLPVEERFLQDPVAEYEVSDSAVRTAMHRRLYRKVRLAWLLKPLQPDGSNGLTVAESVERELPEERQQILRLRNLFIDYRSGRVARLTRRHLEELTVMLSEFDREAEKLPTIESWLEAQDKRLNDGELAGLLQTAEEFIFAFEKWKRPEHRETAVDLLKRAWSLANKVAPEEAVHIAQRLERFGWTRLKNVWMTADEVDALPADDIALAMRQQRVVVGMKAAQVIVQLGQPQKKIRVISSRHVEEIWIYGDANSSQIVVHMQRGRRQAAADSIATLVDP